MSLPYVDVKKDNNSTINNNLTINNYIDDINKSIKIKDDNNDKEDDNDINNSHINNKYINNNYINNNFINNNKININVEDNNNYNKQIINSSKNIKNDSSNNSNLNILNKNEINFMKENNKNKFILNNPPQTVTANNILHSLGNINRYMIGPGNNKMLINPTMINNINNKNSLEFTINNYIDINRPNIINSSRQMDEDFGPKKWEAI